MIAGNLIRMCGVKWIVADIHFLSNISKLWFNKEFLWYQGKGPNTGCSDYLFTHRIIHTYIQLRNLDEMENAWKDSDAFASYRGSYNILPPDTKQKKDIQRS